MLVLGATGPLASEKRRPWIDWIHTMRDQASLVRSFVKWDDQPSSPDALVESLARANLLTRSASHRAGLYLPRCGAAGSQAREGAGMAGPGAVSTARAAAPGEGGGREGGCVIEPQRTARDSRRAGLAQRCGLERAHRARGTSGRRGDERSEIGRHVPDRSSRPCGPAVQRAAQTRARDACAKPTRSLRSIGSISAAR